MTSCSNNQVKPKLPQKKVYIFFRKPLFWPKTTFKNTNFAPPPENCAQKNIKKRNYFYRLKKRWPSYWPYGGQVIDLEMVKMWPSYWPYSIYLYSESWYGVLGVSGVSKIPIQSAITWARHKSVIEVMNSLRRIPRRSHESEGGLLTLHLDHPLSACFWSTGSREHGV